jgi:uncharacterized membrane protein
VRPDAIPAIVAYIRWVQDHWTAARDSAAARAAPLPTFLLMSNPVRYRMAIALVALVAALVALYLHLWKAGLTGPLTCTAEQGCEIAMMSSWGWFLGVDVALIGTVGYVLMFATALWGLGPGRADSPGPSLLLLGLIIPAVLFTVRLKYAEWVTLRTFCPWCFESTVTITLCLVLAWLDYRRVRRRPWRQSAADRRI